MRKDFIKKYFEMMSAHPKERSAEIIERTINSSAPRFYAPYEYAVRYINLIEAGKDIPVAGRKREMYYELHRRYLLLVTSGKPKETAVMEAISSPAPKFYISLRMAQYIISNRNKLKASF